MKYALAMFFIAFSLTTVAQTKPPKKASKIVQVLDSNAFTTCYKFLVSQGFTIQNADRELGIIKTEPNDGLRVSVNILDSTAYYSATFELYLLSGGTTIMNACWCGLAGDYRRNYFKRFMAVFEGQNYTFQ